MKSILILLLISLIPMLTSAQEYVPFPMDSASWVVGSVTGVNQFCVDNDSSLQIGYSRVYYNYDNLVVGFIREENKKIFFKYDGIINPDTTENLIMDFNLTVGDTFFLPYSTDPSHFVIVTKEDSIEMLDGSYRRQLVFDEVPSSWQFDECFDDTLRLTEGIGAIPETAIYVLSVCKGDYSITYCHTYQGDIIYGDCSILPNTESIRETFEVVPNPAADFVQISAERPLGTYKLSLYTISGSKIPVTFVDDRTIDISHLNKGMYVITLEVNEKVYIQKLIKL